MSASILVTKLFVPPTRPELVHRAGLVDQLNEGLDRKLTLISAPAGFGKTMLVSEWVGTLRSSISLESRFEKKIAWLSLDEGDNDPARFLTYLIAALNRANGNGSALGDGALKMLQSPQPPEEEAILTLLINEIAATPYKFLLILDDYHVIESPQVDEALTFLLANLPPQMHLVIATREDPYLPLSRLRARGQLTELRASELRFTTSEAAEFLNQVMGLNLSTEDVTALETRTEGWIAGLQLAAISMRGHEDVAGLIKAFTGSHRLVLDYLIEEVLDQQAPDIQAFLLKTAILNRLTGSLCDSLTGKSNGRATLETLERANLFIVPLDDERRWYRYHHLFAELLRQRLHQTPAQQLPVLHRRASEWYERNGLVDEAIRHALRAEDFERAARLIEEHVDAIWQSGEHTKLRRWLAGLPSELVISKPHLCILHAWDQFTSGQQEAAERSLQAAEEALGADLVTGTPSIGRDQLSDSDRLKIRGRAAAIRAFLAFYRGDVQGISHYARQALEFLPEDDLTWRSTATVALGDAYSFIGEMEAAYRVRLEALRVSISAGNIYMILIASMKLAVTLRQQGWLDQVIELCQRHLRLANENGLSRTVVVGWLLAIWGEVLAEFNDLDGALDLTKKGTELTGCGRDLVMIGWSYLCRIRVLISSGDMASAEEMIHRMDNLARQNYVPPWIMVLMETWQARVWLAQDKLETASHWAVERGLDADGELTHPREMEYIVFARMLIAKGQLDDATRLLQRLLEATETGTRTSRAIEILVLRALSLQAQGDTDQAIHTLGQALALAEPRGFIRIFVDEGPPMARLLHEILSRAEALSHGIAPDYIRRLLAAFPSAGSEKIDPSKIQIPGTEFIEPLSEREIEVLQLIAQGLTNREIATRLYLSLNTIKVHTRNINGKLNVHSRTQAIARSRDLGLLPRK